MINANELRIGNLFHPIQKNTEINLPATGILLKIIELKAFCVSSCFIDEHPAKIERWKEFSYNDLYPIKLNNKILKSCGFKERIPDSDMVLSWVHPTKIILNKQKNGGDYFFLYPYLWSPTNHLRYIHQLQNIFFAITGTELEINI